MARFSVRDPHCSIKTIELHIGPLASPTPFPPVGATGNHRAKPTLLRERDVWKLRHVRWLHPCECLTIASSRLCIERLSLHLRLRKTLFVLLFQPSSPSGSVTFTPSCDELGALLHCAFTSALAQFVGLPRLLAASDLRRSCRKRVCKTVNCWTRSLTATAAWVIICSGKARSCNGSPCTSRLCRSQRCVAQ
jgi:hypothetical protein